MSSGMFRGKESSNRIELSQLVQDLLNFGVLGSLPLLGRGQVGGGVSRCIWGHGGIPTCIQMHAHACTCMYAHVYMYRNCKWLPIWRSQCLACLACLTYACMHVCMEHPHTHTHSHPIHPSATPWGPPKSVKIR